VAYHLTPAGPKPCRVDPSNPRSRGCKYGEHYDSLSEATASYEAFLEDEAEGHLTGMSAAAVRGFSNGEPTPGELSAERSRTYAHWSVANHHLHNSSAIGSPQELYYYSSPQGRLELERRRARYGDRSNPYEHVVASLKDYDPASFDSTLNQEALTELISRGRKSLHSDSGFLGARDARDRRDPALRHYLVEESHRWLNRLTPEQQESVSNLTSDGFLLLKHALGRSGKDERYPSGLVNEDAIYDAHGSDYDGAEAEIRATKDRIATESLQTVRSAFEHAPRLEKPTVIGRGTSTGELHDILGIPENPEGQRELFDSIERGDWNGKPVSAEASLRQLPESASLHGSVAQSFSKQTYDKKNTDDRDIVLAIHARTIASPANVSAWGTGELEVYTNPTSDYRILGGRRVDDGKDSFFILELEEV